MVAQSGQAFPNGWWDFPVFVLSCIVWAIMVFVAVILLGGLAVLTGLLALLVWPFLHYTASVVGNPFWDWLHELPQTFLRDNRRRN